MERNACALDTPSRERRSVNREMMIRILLLLSLTLIDCTFVEERTLTYEAEEDDNITIRWDIQIQTDAALTIMKCVFLSDVTEILYEMIRGVEDSESQHEQFDGRVQIDRDALRGGEIRLHLSRVTVKDSGNYSCDLATKYNRILGRWELENSEYFALKVVTKSEVTPKTTNSGLTAAEDDQGQRAKEDLKIVLQLCMLATLIILMALGASGSNYSWRTTKKNPDPAHELELLAETGHEEELFN
ncbi:uncharacterized protein LOC115796781 isoform X1 [Archocentrus centrarchus]|uniref:uncharacterized protein LOC115796781 isoform X1 n=1 Tax=Archocentrus centrarchus TaxID=63155 RepID=UPI0011E9E8D8|nr:uncharacterized protein LOC115796781 isoform X1 [Archocentrus centrarchus]XP_030609067.1 uncharacterized protein LOC115796781 isoform X1 [Archocentrus centrarchus]XP_030609068.1 uncharacterized protein LOC115796781 isoform X1 [Archocentrus centrarchus]XP_030609069.1 uncharacterized protein LOC115796781 isoform X1 [Archocentrus centrarchus]XP_030609070.1 uncharacterized protein LOC115796781 isoform X1 [Archocentrus centrarchus]